MRLMRMVVPLALIVALAATTTYAACGMCGGQESCPHQMMVKPHAGIEMVLMGPGSGQMVGQSMMMKGHCPMMQGAGPMKGQCPLLKDHGGATEDHWAKLHGAGTCQGRCPMTRAMLRAKTRGLWAGEAVMISLPMGLMLGVTDVSHHGDPNASVDVRGKGPDKSIGLQTKRMGPGLFKITGDLEGIESVDVRVVTPGRGVQNVWFNLTPIMSHRGNHLSTMMGGGGPCGCGGK